MPSEMPFKPTKEWAWQAGKVPLLNVAILYVVPDAIGENVVNMNVECLKRFQ